MPLIDVCPSFRIRVNPEKNINVSTVTKVSPRDRNPQKGKTEQDGKLGARTMILPLAVWAAEPQWDS